MFARYVRSEDNVVPDILSCIGTEEKYEQKFLELKKDQWQECIVTDKMFNMYSDS